MGKKKHGKRTLIKRYIKLLAVSPDPAQNLGLIRNAPDEVIKSICNAAYNLTHGSVTLNPKQKSVFRKYKKAITTLVAPGPSIKHKRRVLVQQGGGFFLPLLLSTVLPLIGSALFQR